MDRLDLILSRFEAEYLELHSITEHRRWNQKRVLTLLAQTMGGRPLDELTPQDVTTFIGSELKAGLHPNTARQHMGMIRSFVTWAFDAGLIDPSRTAQLKSVPNPRGSTARTLPRPYKVSEVRELKRIIAEKYPVLPEYGRGSRLLRRFLGGYSPRLHRELWRHARRLQLEAQIALALEQGLRRTEILNLSIPAMHYDNDQVVVLTAKQKPGSKVSRAIPYTTHARNCVQEWLDFRSLLRPSHDDPWLMLHYAEGLEYQLAPMSMGQMAKALSSLGYSWHRLRHTAATEWLRSGVPLEKVCVFMGHADLEQTRAYTEILGRDMDAAFGKAEADFARRLGLAA